MQLKVTAETFTSGRMYNIIELIVTMREMLVVFCEELDASPDTLLK